MTIDTIQSFLFNEFSKFNSLNYIQLNLECKDEESRLYVLYSIDIEFYEPEFLLENLNYGFDIKTLKKKANIEFWFSETNINFSKKKRINFDKENIHDIVLLNMKNNITIQYE